MVEDGGEIFLTGPMSGVKILILIIVVVVAAAGWLATRSHAQVSTRLTPKAGAKPPDPKEV